MSKKKKKGKRTVGSDSLIKDIDYGKIEAVNGVLTEDYPIFCFKYLSDASFKKSKDHSFFINFLIRLRELSELGWEQIRKSNRHSYGMESIPTEQIKHAMPSCITPDVKKLHVFRANGNNLPFVGIQIGHVFRVLFIETKFGDIYSH